MGAGGGLTFVILMLNMLSHFSTGGGHFVSVVGLGVFYGEHSKPYPAVWTCFEILFNKLQTGRCILSSRNCVCGPDVGLIFSSFDELFRSDAFKIQYKCARP